jgi:hypothetical protein
MVKVIRVADDGTELAAVELDDFTIEVIYAGIAEMLQAAATCPVGSAVPSAGDLPREARQRRQKILTRIRD